MRKLAPARVSYRDDFFILYRVYIMTGSFHISLFEGTLHVDKIHVRFKIANITGRPISHRNGWSFRVYMIPLRDFVPEWNSRPGTTTGVNSRRGDSRRHDILWWYHVNKYRAIRGTGVNSLWGDSRPVSCKHPLTVKSLCVRNPMVWIRTFKWNLTSNSCAWYYLLFSVRIFVYCWLPPLLGVDG